MSRPESPRRILAIAPNWVGDVVMCTPALRALARRYPHAELCVAALASGCATLAGLPFIQCFVTLPPKSGVADLYRGARAAGPRPDLAVIFPHSFRSAALAWLSGAQMRIGYDRGGRRALLTQAVPPHRENGKISPIYMVDEYLELARAAGAEDDGLGPELAVAADDLEALRAQLPTGRPIVAMAPGAAFGPSKCWPAERFAAVADALTERKNATVILLTGPGEEQTRADVLAAARHPMLDVQGSKPSLGKLKAAISLSDLVIGNDSAPRHMAVAFKRPVICIMGPTSPRYTAGPYETGAVLRVDVECGPCQRPICTTDHRCMTRITPEMLVLQAESWI